MLNHTVPVYGDINWNADNPRKEVNFRPDWVLPVLRDFAALCTPLADGTVPAVEVAKLAAPGYADAFGGYGQLGNTAYAEYSVGGGYRQVYIHDGFGVNDEGDSPRNQAAIVDYLRRNHFAVNLQPHQFIPLV